MIDLTLDMVQYDCPYIETTTRYDVSFSVLHWEFHRDDRHLETRLVVEADDEVELTNGIAALRDHDRFLELECLSRHGDSATLRTCIGETDAMGTIQAHDGYITGPFEIADGSELWNVGFDTRETAEAALAALERDNDFTVDSRAELDAGDVWEISRNVDTALTLIRGCESLTETERRTLETAFRQGFFETPRNVTLAEIGEELDVSGPAVSKNLRRAQRKLTRHVVDAMGLGASR